ncbi:HAD-like domain containing protein [Amanita muscaria]
MAVRLTTAQDFSTLIDKYDTWMFDCDGVIWRGDHMIEGVIDVLRMLRGRKKKIVFVTNNASKSRKSYKTKFDQLGVPVSVDEIYGSAYAAAVYLSSVLKLPKSKKAYVVGMQGLEEELAEEGISFIGGTDPADNTLIPFSLADFTPDPDVAAVVCGLDTSINYTKLSKAFQHLLRNEGCHFVATNGDSTFPSAHGLLPGAGAIWAPLQSATGRGPVCTGKPSTIMLDCIRAKIDYDPKRTIIVGDRLDTDILFGQRGGLSTLLVLTGITSEAEIYGPNASRIIPDFVARSLGDLRVLLGQPN